MSPRNVPKEKIPTKIAKPALYVVKWHDILSDPAWVGKNPEKEVLAVCVTVGWIVHSAKDKLVMADSKTADGDWGGVTVIPSGVILDKTRITARPPESFLQKQRTRKKRNVR